MISQGQTKTGQAEVKGKAVKISGSLVMGPKGSSGIVIAGKGEGRLKRVIFGTKLMVRLKSGRVVVLPDKSVLTTVTE